MKTKIILLIGAVALVTLSFTFATVNEPLNKESKNISTSIDFEPVGGLFADQVVE
jgi:hypothetical protein